MRAQQPIRKQRGLTIIELMVSLAISLIVLSALTYIYVSSRGSYRTNEGLARVQENGRFAMDWLSREIRGAGYYGCVSRGPAPVVIARQFNGFAMGLQAVAGYEWPGTDGQIPAWVATGTAGGKPSNYLRGDVLLLSGMIGTAARILDDNPKAINANIKVDRCIGLKQDDLVLATNCARSTIFRITNNPEPTNANNCPIAGSGSFNTVTDAADNNFNDEFRLNPPYLVSSQAILFKFGAYAYYIGSNPAGRPALYRTNMDLASTTPTEEVVENIENMDLLFGEDTDGDGFADQYRNAAQVANWQNVVSVRVTMVAVSPDAGATNKPQNYYFGANNAGTAVAWDTKNDLRLRQVFSSTVAIRNKLP